MKRKREPVCLVAGRPCPKNADPSAGDFCPWWWSVQEESGDGQTRQRPTCGIPYLPHFFRAYGTDIVRAANCVQDDREEQRKVLGQLDESLVALGVPDTVSLLAQVGLRTAISHRQLAARNEGDAP